MKIRRNVEIYWSRKTARTYTCMTTLPLDAGGEKTVNIHPTVETASDFGLFRPRTRRFLELLNDIVGLEDEVTIMGQDFTVRAVESSFVPTLLPKIIKAFEEAYVVKTDELSSPYMVGSSKRQTNPYYRPK